MVGGKCIKKGYILGHHGGLRCWLPLCLSKFLLLTYVRCSHNVFISDAGRRRLMMIIIIRRRPPCTTPRVYIARNRNRWGSPYFTQGRYINAIILVMCHYLSCGFTWTELQEYLFIYLLTRSILILFRIILYTHALSHPPFRPQCVLIQSQQYLPRFLRYSE